MGKTVKTNCIKIMEIVYANKLERIAGIELDRIIAKIAGFDRGTKRQYKEALVFFEYLSAPGNGMFTVIQKPDTVSKIEGI